MYQRALFVGRFQPFHLGHLEAVRRILKEARELVIVIGSAEKSHELDNPFTAGERMEMIDLALKGAGIQPAAYALVPVPDAAAHTIWVSQLVAYAPKFEVVYSNQALTRRLLIESGYEVKEIPLVKRAEYSATEIRKRILAGEHWANLVPKEIYEFIKRTKGDERMQDIAKSDKKGGEPPA